MPINRLALQGYDELASAEPDLAVHDAKPFTVAFRTVDERQTMLDELEQLDAAGQQVSFDLVDGNELRDRQPVLSDQLVTGLQLHDQRFIDPARVVTTLAAAVERRGGEISAPFQVLDIVDDGSGVQVSSTAADEERFDAAVLATGARLNHLGRRFGVRMPVQAGRGYSFSVKPQVEVPGPVYLPIQRIACTPLNDRLRIAGLMEFASPGQPPDPQQLELLVESARPLLANIDVEDREDEWVGSRPVTADGLPLIGPTASDRVFVAGGHGMWGIVLGPITGKLLAHTIAEGRSPSELAPFDPQREPG